MFFAFSIAQSQHWEKVTNIPIPYNSGYYLDIFFLPENPNYGWACGFNGYVIRTTNYGQTWQGTVVPDPAYHLESIHFVNPNVGYVSGVEGIWKSTNGGASFFDVTPKDSAIRGFWGTYFLNENLGVVVGGGCDGMQRFYKTTDGGQTWTLFKTNIPNTGLTDLILYPNGLGYAVSSGYLWQSTDFGSTWNIFKGTGASVWQEEISIYGNSIVLPYAGSTCSGGGNTGGVSFSTDFGNTWKNFQIGQSMFGACLVSETSAWACGYGKSVYYTSNAGNTWVLRNCGIGEGDLDDITFLSETEGWVCGQGIYKLKPTTFATSKENIDFGELCYPDIRIDSLKVVNSSFYMADLQVQLMNNPEGVFTIVSPKMNSQINSCDSLGIVIRFAPKSKTTYNGKLSINLISADGKTTLYKEIDLTGIGNNSTIRPEFSTIIVDSIAVGSQYAVPLRWFASGMLEQLKSVAKILNDKDQINFDTKLPLVVNQNGSTTYFSIKLLDTGWTQQNFRFTMLPCNIDTLIQVRAYGYSPIINSIDSIHFVSTCRGKVTKRIPVWNTGNSNLLITSQGIVGDQSKVKILGWTSGKTIPVVIPPRSSDTVIVEIDIQTPVIESFYLKLNNNDRTLTRGNKDPINILLVARMNYEDVKIRDTIVNFGNICINSSKDTILRLENKGNIPAYLKIIDSVANPFALMFPWTNKIEKNDFFSFTAKFAPRQVGFFSDTLIFSTGECGSLRIILQGYGVVADFSVNPQSINDLIKQGETKNYLVDLQNTGLTNIKLDKIYLNPPNSDLQLIINEKLPYLLPKGSSSAIQLQISPKSNIIYFGQICFEANEDCPIQKCIPVNITSIHRFLVFGNKILPKKLICNGNSIDTVLIINRGTTLDTIVSIELDGNAEFTLKNVPSLPTILAPSDTLKIIVQFNSIDEGNFSTFLNIKTIDPDGQLLSMPIDVEFKKTTIVINKNFLDFGISEKCDNPISYEFTLSNIGLNENYITIISSNLPNYVKIEPSQFSIEGNSQQRITVTIDPSKISNDGEYTHIILLQSTICPQQLSLEIKGEQHNPILLYSPNSLDFGNVEVEEIKIMKVLVTNTGKKSRTLNLIKQPRNSEFVVLTNFPLVLQPHETKQIEISFQSFSSGKYIDNIALQAVSSCIDTTYIELIANAPNEFYNSTVWIGEYLARVDENITIDVNLTSNLRKLYARGLDVEINFDEYLFYPYEVKWKNKNGNFENTNFNYGFGKLKFIFDENQAQQILSSENNIFKIYGKVLASNPPTTPLKINKFDITTNKAYEINKRDGLIKLEPICLPEVSHKIIIIEEPKMQIVAGENIWQFNFSNLKGDEHLEIYNLLGIQTHKTILTKNTKTIEINIENYPKGIYFIKFNDTFTKIIK